MTASDNSSVRGAIAAKLRESFRYEPQLTNQSEVDRSPVIVLEKVTVVDSFKRFQLEHGMEEVARRRKLEKFSLKTGGPILSKDIGKVRAEFGIWGSDGPFTFLKFRW